MSFFCDFIHDFTVVCVSLRKTELGSCENAEFTSFLFVLGLGTSIINESCYYVRLRRKSSVKSRSNLILC